MVGAGRPALGVGHNVPSLQIAEGVVVLDPDLIVCVDR